MTTRSYVDPRTGKLYPLETPRWCSEARTPLLVTPGDGISRSDIETSTRSLWRYRASLPLHIVEPISLGEGSTPLVQTPWKELRPFFKLEWFNPTGSFKDRGSSVMLSFLRQIGVSAVVADSSGNGGSSIAGFGTAGGLRVKVLVPASTSPAKIAQIRIYGADIQLIDGPREACEAEAIRQSDEVFYASHNWHAFFLEGTKSLAYELWEDLNFNVPDNIVIPVGGGSSLLGCAFGFRELMKAGQISKLPRLFASQPFNCSPIDAAFNATGLDSRPREVRKTVAEGTAIAHPLRTSEILAALRESGGGTVAVTEDEISSALRRLVRLGLLAEPTSATAAAALDKLSAAGEISSRDTTVVLLTGTGLKAASTVADLVS